MKRGTNQRGGWLPILGVGCLMVTVLAVGAVYLAYCKMAQFAKDAAATAVQTAATQVLDSFNYPKAERDAALKPLNDFASDIRNGKVTMSQGAQVAQKLAAREVTGVITAVGFGHKYVGDSGLDDKAKEAAKVTVSRFAQGLATSALSVAAWDKVHELFSTETTTTDPANGTTKTMRVYKKALTDEELTQCLAVMKAEADKAGVADTLFVVDIAALVRQAVDEGMKAGAVTN